jgi:hypothetical protein
MSKNNIEICRKCTNWAISDWLNPCYSCYDSIYYEAKEETSNADKDSIKQ